MSPWLALSPLLVVGIGSLTVMMVDAFSNKKDDLSILSSAILIAAAAIAGSLWFGGLPPQTPEILAPYLAVDAMSQFFNITICGGAALCAMLAGGYLREHDLERGDFYSMLMLCAFGAMVLSSATDLVSVFIGLETMSLGVYCLVAFRRGSARAIEGAIKYFLLGSFAAAILLFGSALLYGATGHTDLLGIGQTIRNGNAELGLALVAMSMLVVGLAFKVSAVPFHMWTPDAYEGAITPATAFMSVVVKAAAFAVMLRVLITCFGDPLSAGAASGWPPIIAVVAVVTMIYGNIAAIYQSNIKRMLAYSSIAHAGYILIGVVAAFRVQNTAVSAVLYYLMAYTVSNVLAFGSLIVMGTRGKEAVTFDDLAGAGKRHPMAALPFIIGMLSLMGFPPTAGFFGKYYVFNAALQADSGMHWLVIIAVIASAIGAFYYLRVIVYLFMKDPETGAPQAVAMKSGYVVTALVLSAYFVLEMGITPSNYLKMALAAAAGLV
ncbi:MAG: NADH-quinone oxidoreductase subunit N [Deltaproteobacteria bacterium]|nr:NADH-quinone oxidoreductase subunit N [Deltaproteobacteria bacterium]